MTRPPPPIHFAVTDGRAIFLDLHRNRYFALSASANAAFLSAAGPRTLGMIAPEILQEIVKGLMPMDHVSCWLPSATITTPVGDRRAAQRGVSAPMLQVMAAWLAIIAAMIAIRICPLHRILTKIGRVRSPAACSDGYRSADRLGAAFRKAGLLVRSHDNCLRVTLAFVALCRACGFRPALVIGVRVNPFAAHCWSQDGGIVLNDDCEHVRLYQPILVL